MLSYREIGAAAMLSRASAGVCRSALVFSMPGSSAAVRLAMDELILPQLGHLAWLLRGK
jgi:molybdenum cofactor biosynthesis protein B